GPLGVEHAVGATFGDRAEFGDGDRHEVGHEGQRLAVEVAARYHLAAFGEDDRVVHHRTQLDLDHPAGVGDGVGGGAVDLGGAAQRVGVLDGVGEVVGVARPDLGSLQQGGDTAGRLDLAGVGAE